jgi:predicted membrane protein
VARGYVDSQSLYWGVIFGSIGLAYFVYGKRQRSVVPLVAGLGLMFFPYFISNTVLLVIVGLLLSAIPYFVRL